MLDELVGEAPAVVVVRYFWPYCKTGLHWCQNDRVRAMIDVDDRDDLAPLHLGRATFRRLQAFAIVDRALRMYIRRLMDAMMQRAAHVWFVRAEDAADFAGVSLSLAPNVPFAAAPQIPPPSEADEVVLFVGSAAHLSNVEGVRWFLTACWPKIRKSRPSARFRLVGSGEWPRFVEGLSSADGAEIVGFVDELAPEYAVARVVISPVFDGGGSKIKVVEACAFGRPIVATRHSCRGFGEDIESAIPTAEDADAFASETARLLADTAAADELASQLKSLQKQLLSRVSLERIISADVARVEQLRNCRQ
jgi:glycosyltransferase involved in cell wall biosynthesis